MNGDNVWERIKQGARKFCDFVWHGESLASWVVSLVLAFIIIKFIFFPLISLIFATSLPLVIVESGSMHHPGGFFGNTFGTTAAADLWWEQAGGWYEERNFTRENLSSWSFRTGMEKGDIIVVFGTSPEKLMVGNVIIFNAGQRYPIIHRIVKITETNEGKIFETKGDNNAGQLSIEKEISEEQIIGKAIFKIPKLGWIKLIFVGLF